MVQVKVNLKEGDVITDRDADAEKRNYYQPPHRHIFGVVCRKSTSSLPRLVLKMAHLLSILKRGYPTKMDMLRHVLTIPTHHIPAMLKEEFPRAIVVGFAVSC